MTEYTIAEIIEMCKKFSKTISRCTNCPVYRMCNAYFISLPKYWKIKEGTNGKEKSNT